MEAELNDTVYLVIALTVLGHIIFTWLLFSIGMHRVFKKLQFSQRWMAWIPGLRYAALGSSLDVTGEGIAAGVLEVLVFLSNYLSDIFPDERYGTLFELIYLVLWVALTAYSIRLYLKLITVYQTKKLWIILFIFADWLALMIFGFSKKLQPQRKLNLYNELDAGHTPKEIAGTEVLHAHTGSESGLSVDVRERTAKNLGKKVYLLKDIALDIPNGSMVLLLGGSGSGKTTLLNAIIGYEKADATILLNGVDVYKEYDRMIYRIGFVPQQNLIRGNDTVVRTVSDAAAMRLPTEVSHQDRENKIDEVLDLLGLAAGADGLVAKKSGGQLRRISIAMELVTGPELFVLDEPDSGLDGVIAREIFQKLRQIADEGKIVLVITHTPDRVIDLFDKVIVLARDSGRVGRLGFYGTPKEAKEFFGKDTMEDIVMSINRKEEGGEGKADYYIEKYAQMVAEEEQKAGKGGAA